MVEIPAARQAKSHRSSVVAQLCRIPISPNVRTCCRSRCQRLNRPTPRPPRSIASAPHLPRGPEEHCSRAAAHGWIVSCDPRAFVHLLVICALGVRRTCRPRNADSVARETPLLPKIRWAQVKIRCWNIYPKTAISTQPATEGMAVPPSERLRPSHDPERAIVLPRERVLDQPLSHGCGAARFWDRF